MEATLPVCGFHFLHESSEASDTSVHFGCKILSGGSLSGGPRSTSHLLDFKH